VDLGFFIPSMQGSLTTNIPIDPSAKTSYSGFVGFGQSFSPFSFSANPNTTIIYEVPLKDKSNAGQCEVTMSCLRKNSQCGKNMTCK